VLFKKTIKMIPKNFFLTKGVGKHKEQLQSFELALRNAGIQKCNIVNVSSIIPPGCKLIPREKGLQRLRAGEITFIVLARNSSNEPHRLIASSIGVAIPTEKNSYGYLSEHHSFGQTEEVAGDYAEDLAATMLASTMGMEFDAETAWDERKQQFKASGLIIKTTNITQSATVDKNGLWTTVIAATVFVPRRLTP
jgi:arginine decarboxylase